MDYRTEYERWQQALSGTHYADQLSTYETNEEEKTNAFYQSLSFGTAGMRGVLGMGPNRMNVFTVRHASAGLADYLQAAGEAASGVVIAYDSRYNSALFAKETALTLAARGVKAYLYDKLTGVPQLSFSILVLRAAAGVVITASHNPAKYNGYKVYGKDGGQLADAEGVTACIRAISDIFSIQPMEEKEALEKGLLEYVGDSLDQAYYAKVRSLAKAEVWKNANHLNIVYTPLHGTGYLPVSRVLSSLGVGKLSIVDEQRLPDPAFPTVSAPNPEDPDAFRLAFALAEQVGGDLALATDPDCDRLGVAVKNENGRFSVLSGNQIGCLLLSYLLERDADNLPSDGFIVRSLVSTPLADKIAAAYGIEAREVLTGFKYIAQQINHSLETGKGRFLFGFEESYGFLAGDFVRDKDACIAAMLISEAACWYQSRGSSLLQALRSLYQRFGWYEETVLSFVREGALGLEQIRQAMESLRQRPLTQIGAEPVLALRDYQTRLRRAGNESSPLTLPQADVLYFELEEGSFILRPSGTEPKLKTYINVSGPSADTACRRREALVCAAKDLLEGLLY